MSESISRVRQLMNHPDHTRNISVVGHIAHGKSTLVDHLIQGTGIISAVKSGETRPPNVYSDEHDITVSSTVVPLIARLPNEEALKGITQEPQEVEVSEFLVNLIDTPGHVDFSSEVTAALRVTDGALVVVDAVQGVCSQTEAVLQQALGVRVKPVVIINKIDHALLEPGVTAEDLYQSFSRTIESVNVIVTTHSDKNEAFGDVQVHPSNGTVAFGSGLQGWAFTLRQFASRYAQKFGIDRMKITERLWGDNYFNPHTKKWTEIGKHESNDLERSFNQFVMGPILKIFDAFAKADTETLASLCGKFFNIEITDEEKKMPKKDLLKFVLCKSLPAADALVEMMVIHLPSPVIAQKYRAEILYEGPTSDAACIGMHGCDPKADLMLYVSKMMISTTDQGRLYAFGRVFAGTVRSGMKVRIQGPNYVPGKNKKEDLFVKPIQQTVLMASRDVESIEGDIPAGNIIGLVGVDQFLLKNGTLTTDEAAHNFKAMKSPSALPIVQRSVQVRNANDLPKLVEGLKYLSKSDSCVSTLINESGDHVVAGTGEFHLKVCLRDLENYVGIPLRIDDPVVAYRETVQDKSSIVALSKSPNRYNRLYVTAEPLGEPISKAIESGEISSRDYASRRGANTLSNFPEWNISDARKIWAFGPESTGPNLIVDQTNGMPYLHEIKDSFISGFQWATQAGPVAEEPMRGVRFNIMDVTLFADAIHRGGGQIIPTARRVSYASFLLAQPALQEPIYLAEMTVPERVKESVFAVINRRRGRILSEKLHAGTLMIKAHIPVAESFGFDADIRAVSSGQAFSQLVFNHWEVLSNEGSVLDATSPVGKMVTDIRKRKGISEVVLGYESYYDKL